jgi:anion-transporting  ArsA/GET3 family ATPase
VRHAPDARTRDAILANPLYANITGRFVQSHDYIAMERLYELHGSGRYDLVVVDTPPSRHALDFLDAPERMADFFGSRLLRWLTVPSRSRLVSVASKPFYQVADRVLGSQFLGDIAEFFTLLGTMHAGFVERARAVSRVLADRRCTFVVVTTLEAPARREADWFVAALAERRLALGAVVLNKVLPEVLLERRATEAAGALRRRPDEVAAEVVDDGHPGSPEAVARVLGEVARSFSDVAQAARREADERRALAAASDVVVAVPHARRDVADLAGVLAIGHALWG